jgi:hypothetical protein
MLHLYSGKQMLTSSLKDYSKFIFIFSFYLIIFRPLELCAQAPTITSLTPLSAKPGDAITLTGTGFNNSTTNNIVFFGATKGTVTEATTTSITVTVPTGATYGPISLLNTQTGLATSSVRNFTPTFSPARTNIVAGNFHTKQDFTTGSNPQSIAIGDLDGDGKPDLVVANYDANTISLFHNTSTIGSLTSSSFASKVDFATGTNPSAIAITDLDGDGKLDLAVTNLSSNTVSVFHNTSSSGTITINSFAAKVDFTTGSSPRSIAIADLDGNGRPDLAVANSASASVSIFRNTAISGSITSSSFAAKVDFTSGSNPRSVAIADLDGDSKPDIATANLSSNTISILRNTATVGSITLGGGPFSPPKSFADKVDITTESSPIQVTLGDVDNDGKLDLMVSSISFFISLHRNIATSGSITTGSFASRINIGTSSGSSPISLGDLDGSGRIDMASADSPFITLYRNLGVNGGITTNSFTTRINLTTISNHDRVAIGDLDGDGKPDLAAIQGNLNTVSVYHNTSSNNANLSSLTISSGTLSPSFSASNTSYNTTITNGTTSIRLNPTREDVNASITINGAAATSGVLSGAIPLNIGSNTITIIVTAEDATTKTYTLTVNRLNNAPIVANAIPNQNALENSAFNFQFAANTFTDNDAGTTLTYTAQLAGGSALPVWLSFNPSTRTFSGTPANVDVGTISIDVIADDGSGGTVTDNFDIVVITVLPVSLNEFTAKSQTDGTVLINWDTFSEQNNDYFEISRSTNRQNFDVLNTIKGNGNSTKRNLYNYLDKTPSIGLNYYKLTQVDVNGARKELGVRSVNVNLTDETNINIFPNPSTDFVTIVFEASKFNSIALMDMNGKVISKKTLTSQTTETTISLRDLTPTSYIIQLIGDKSLVNKIIMKK